METKANKEFRMLNPRLDGIFKMIFTQNTEDSRGALHSFLEACTGRKISEVYVTANDVPLLYSAQRGIRHDINCRFEDGKLANIEMQGTDIKHSYGLRAEYQAARLLSSQMVEGDFWPELREVWQISVLDFVYCSRANEEKVSNLFPIHHYKMTAAEDGSGLDGLVNIVFIELPKIKKLETKGIENLNSLEKWGIFLKEADKPEQIELIKEITKHEEGIQMAYNTLNKMSESQEAWLMQTAQLIAKKDYMTQMEYSRQEGLAEGTHKNQIQVAKNLISMKVLTDEQICQASGLTIEELVELKNNLE